LFSKRFKKLGYTPHKESAGQRRPIWQNCAIKMKFECDNRRPGNKKTPGRQKPETREPDVRASGENGHLLSKNREKNENCPNVMNNGQKMGFARTDCTENTNSGNSVKRPRDENALGHSPDVSQKDLNLLAYDMKNFVNSRYPNLAVEDIKEMVWSFARANPGYQKTYGIDYLQQLAENLNQRGWS